jgi:uncharacterized protein YecE (DUF72 family)
MPMLVGTSGWQYKHWNNGPFYPPEVAQSAQLAFYAARFQIVEVNFTFYRLPEASAFRSWAEQTPEDFVFDIKASRFLTHFKKLKDPEEPVERLMSRARELGPKLRTVLLQLPPNFPRNEERLDRVLALLGGRARVAVEFRHESWYEESVREVLARHGAALCLADRGAQMITPAWRTAPWGYFRFHGGSASPPGCYDLATLDERAALMADLWGPDGEVHVFFNNDWHACALRDATWFTGAASRRGLTVARVAPLDEIRVG